jgi:fumarylacetoacetate (FAA) hydrolase
VEQHLCKTRNARAGVIGSGTVSNKDAGKGYSRIAEKRCLEMIADGIASTPSRCSARLIRK